MKNYIILFAILFSIFSLSCGNNSEKNSGEKITEYNDDSIRCPKGKHTDSIVEIVYGMPSEELFNQADSGLVVLGGCELPEKPLNHYCKKHSISFR